jgi:putative SOS response-associated peptidase YedK
MACASLLRRAVVKPIDPEAMPVILTRPEEIELWMTGSTKEALALQRPLPDNVPEIVARGQRKDGAEAVG